MNIKSLQLKRAFRSVLLVLLLSVVGMGKMYAQNLIVNPDFESGNTGFFSDYQYMTTGSVDAGQYCVDVNSTGHGVGMVGWPTILGYGGSGNYMLVNGFGGNTNPTKAAWKQTVTVTPNTDYIFSCQVVNLAQSVFGYSPNPAILRLKINGSTVGGDYTVAQNNSWHEWSASWHNGNATQAEIAIYDVYTGDSGLGDDFGLDHLSLTPQATYSVNAVDDDVPLCVEYYQTYQIDVLANDIITPSSQMSGATVQVIQAPAHGNASWNNNTHKINYTYMDQGYYGGLDQFKYRVTIPHGESSDAWVYVNTVRMPNVGWIDAPGPICAGGPLGIPIPFVEPDYGIGQWVCSQTQNGTFSPFDANNVPLSMNGWWIRYTASNDCGEGSSNQIQLTVTNGPSFTGQTPQIQPVCAGNNLNLTPPSFNANGLPIISQGWVISQTENGEYQSFSLNNISSSYNGWYICYMVESSCGAISSSPKSQLVVTDAPSVGIIQAPLAINAGGSFNLTQPTIQPNGSPIFNQGWQIAATQSGNYSPFDNNNVPYSYNGYWIRYFADNDCGRGYSNAVQITVYQDDNNIVFADANVKAICVANWDTNGDGELSYAEAAAVTYLGQVFRSTAIASFDELQYFINLNSIENYSFRDCTSLASIVIPNSVTSIGVFAFSDCSSLTSIEIPNFVTSIGEWAFSWCTGVASLEIPNSVTSVGEMAFYGCSGLTSLEIPNSVTSIGEMAFYACSSLSLVISYPSIPPELGDNVFYNTPNNNMSIFVYCGALESYQLASGWSTYNLRGMCSGEVSATANPSEGGTISGPGWYEDDQICTLVATANDGYVFACWMENGNLVSSEATYSIPVSGDRTFVALFMQEGNIVFADDNVKSICVAHWDTNHDGELSYAEAAAVANLGQVFSYNTAITSFDELQYFINLNSIVNYEGWLSGCFSGCTNLASIEIPNSVSSIGEMAFSGCCSLTSIEIPTSVTSIGDHAFSGCTGLTSIEIPNSVAYIQSGAFSGCSSLVQIVVESGNTEYDSRGNCNAIIETSTNELVAGCKTTIIPNSVTSIGWAAFSSCTSLTSIEIPNSVTSIKNYAFSGCSGLTSIEIPNSVTSIGYYAFYDCSSLSLIISYPSTPPSLGDNVFYNTPSNMSVFVPCGALEAYQMANGWSTLSLREMCAGEITATANPIEGGTVIGAGYYEGGTACTLTATPNEGYLFLNWSKDGQVVSSDSIYSFIVAGDADFVANFAEEGDVCALTFDLFDSYGDGYTGNYLVVTDENGISQRLTIESGSSAVYTIPFLNDSHLALTWLLGSYPEDCSFTVSYSNGNVIYHGENLNENFNYEFDVDCVEMPAITFNVTAEANPIDGGTITGTGQYDYNAICTLTAIANEGYTFVNWTQDGTIVSNDVEYSFYVVDNVAVVANFIPLGNISFADANVKAICVANWDTNGDGELSYEEAAAVMDLGNVFRENGTITTFNELQYFTGLTTIGNYAFSGCRSLTAITLPDAVVSIGDLAFHECTNLTSLILPDSVVSIGRSAFDSCRRLSSLSIPNSVTSIGSSAFALCYGLTSMTIPNTVTSIGYGLFYCCSSLVQIVVETGNEIYDSRENCNAIINSSTNELVAGCKNTIIPNSVTSIGNSAFDGCFGLTSLNIPDAVTSIGRLAFRYCWNLTSIDIPNSMTSIGEGAFDQCAGLTSIVIPGSVTSIGGWAFRGCSGFEQIVVESENTVYDSRENCNAIINTNSNELMVGCKNTFIPNSVTSIGYYAFYCTSLISIIIPDSVTTIGDYAFNGCSGLTSMTVLAETSPALGSDVFSNASFPIYVPYKSLNDYKTATNWSDYEDRIFPMAYTTISGYGDGEGNYRFIASPLVENTTPTAVDNMITETAYDLYRFDQSKDAEWQNYKFPENTPNFFLTNGLGYLYANAEDVNLIFKGEFNEDNTKEVGLVYNANAELAGWNLVGNPFPVNAYANKSYYTINEEGTAVEPNMVSSATAIPACTGVMVMAEAEGETVVFSTDTPEAATNQGCLQIALAQTTTRGNAIQDKAIVSFNAVDRLEKFVFNKEKAVISIPQGGKELSIACTDKQGEMPLNFKATKNGEYTLTIHSEAVELDYLHLIDNLTGADVDLQVSPAYTYAAKTTDYASRFRLVFSGKEADCPSTGSETFAFVNNGNIIITGAEADAVLQIVDITGRIIVDTDVSRNISTNGMTSGVYVLRLIDGDKVRTQKIVME